MVVLWLCVCSVRGFECVLCFCFCFVVLCFCSVTFVCVVSRCFGLHSVFCLLKKDAFIFGYICFVCGVACVRGLFLLAVVCVFVCGGFSFFFFCVCVCLCSVLFVVFCCLLLCCVC